eukprot:12019634-Karenia_brevis.AAC.1
MVRPFINSELSDGMPWSGYDVERLRIAALARAIQAKLYLHTCSPSYCLQDRSSCRFFFPWPRQPYQQYDENTDRIALERLLPEDDQWLNPHNLSLAMFSPATVHFAPFDPDSGADQAAMYVTKYAAKPEKHFYMEAEESYQKDSVKFFLKARTVGLCMAHNRLFNFRVVRSTVPVVYHHTEFVPKPWGRCERDAAHREKCPDYPDP